MTKPRSQYIYFFLHSITWGRHGCLLWHNNRNILTNWLVVASDMTQALQNNFLLKYYMPWLQECIKTNFLFKYCTQWLQEYCFCILGPSLMNFALQKYCFEVLNVVIARVLFSTWWNIEWCIKTIFFSSIIWSDCKNTVFIFCIKQYYRTPKN